MTKTGHPGNAAAYELQDAIHADPASVRYAEVKVLLKRGTQPIRRINVNYFDTGFGKKP